MSKKTALFIFNPNSGDAAQSDAQLAQIKSVLDELRVETQVVTLTPNLSVSDIAKDAAKRGIQYVIASGGDNTMDAVARGIVGTHSRLVIIPTGTRNNIAHALNLPLDVAEATRLIGTGKRIKVDMGRIRTGDGFIYFLELVSVGLGAAMFTGLDEAQKGNIAKIGDLLSTFISHPPSDFTFNLDRGRQKLNVQALTMVVLNMPFIGANFQLSSYVDFQDGLLDVFVYADIGKLDLLTHALQVAQGVTDDSRIRHLRVKNLVVDTYPVLPVMIDGEILESHHLEISRAAGALNVMVPAESALPQASSQSAESSDSGGKL